MIERVLKHFQLFETYKGKCDSQPQVYSVYRFSILCDYSIISNSATKKIKFAFFYLLAAANPSRMIGKQPQS